MSDSIQEAKRLLAQLKQRLVAGEIDRAEYQAQRELVLGDLTPEERTALVTGAPSPQPTTPAPGTPPPITPSTLGPSGASGRGLRTAIPSLADLDLRPGMVLLEQWRLVRELGRGGFGAVFEAEELHLHDRQAVKVLDPAMVAKEELLARFRREVSLMRRLVHPRIVRVYDYREDPKQLVALISMELVTGGSVKQLLTLARRKQQPIPMSLALEILHQTLEALAEAHGQGVIHRDVTPGNVLLAGGTPEQLLADPKRDPQVKLVDFGIAGLVERSELSQKSRVLGTAAYVAPEVLDPAVEVTPAADVYGAGAMAYELLTGRLPLGRFAEPGQLRADLPAAINGLVLDLLDSDPARRPKSAQGARDVPRILEEQARLEAERRLAEERARREAEEARRRQEAELERQRSEEAQREAERKREVARQREVAAREQERAEAERRRLEDKDREEVPRARPAVRPVDRSNFDEPGSQATRGKGPSPATWVGGGLALLALLFAVGWGISSRGAVRERPGTEARTSAQPLGTWRDERTGLLWSSRDNGSDIGWGAAKSYCENLTLGGFSDWRLPSIEELERLYDGNQSKSQRGGAITLTNWWVWSGDLKSDDSSAAWVFHFGVGGRGWSPRVLAIGGRALCVRRSGG